MPRYDTNMTGIAAAIIANIPDGHYRFKIGTPKAFERKEMKDGVQIVKNYGIRYPVEVVDVIQGDGRVGDKQFVTLYMHTKDSIGFSKSTQIVLNGFDQTPEGDAAFNEKFAGADFGYDTESGEVGEGWKACENSLFEAVVSIKKSADGENQKWNKLIPFRG